MSQTHAIKPATEETLGSILGAIKANGSGVQPVSAASLPLPSGAATAGNQTTQITSLSSLQSDSSLRWSGGKLFYSAVLAASGDTAFITPTAGKKVQVVWVSIIPNSDNTAANLIKVKFGAGGTPFYQSYALAHWEPFTGAVDEALYLNAANAQPVAVTVHYKEI